MAKPLSLFAFCAGQINDAWRYSWHWKTDSAGRLTDEALVKALDDAASQEDYFTERASGCRAAARRLRDEIACRELGIPE